MTLRGRPGHLELPSPGVSSPFHHQRKDLDDELVLWEMRGQPTDAEWAQVMTAAKRWLREQESRGRKWGIVVDPSGIENVTSTMRRAAGQWRSDNMPLIANTCECAAYVAPSTVIRSAIAAVFWFAQPVVPVSVKASQREAIDWVQSRLHEGDEATAPLV